LVGITIDEFDAKTKKAKAYSYVKASLFIKQISLEDFSKFEDHLDEFPGFVLQPRTTRSYTYPILANALGYISEISKYELTKDTVNYYHSGDYIGKSGLESNYETYLRGLRGKNLKLEMLEVLKKDNLKMASLIHYPFQAFLLLQLSIEPFKNMRKS